MAVVTRRKIARWQASGIASRPATLIERALLLAPDRVARAAAARARRPEERWILRQPRTVRESYARAVRGTGNPRRAAEIWLLRESERVRESYVREVLED